MLTIIYILLGAALALFAYLCVKAANKSLKYPFQSWEKSDLPFITIDVQGHSLNMITDSAAAVSVIRRDVLENLTYEPNSRNVNLASISGDGVKSEVVAIPINIKGKEIKTDFVVYDGNDIAGFRRHGIIMDGILGVEFLKKTGGIVDFSTQTVKFP